MIALDRHEDAAMVDAVRGFAAAQERRCIVTGDSASRTGLIRFVVSPAGEVTVDLAEKLPGRGLWVAADADALAGADARAFSRAAKARVTVPPDLARKVEEMLVRRLADYVGVARRAGALVVGFEKCRAALRAGRGALLLAARDGAEDGRAKLCKLAPALDELAVLSAAEMGAAIGREAAVHAVVTDTALARRIAREGLRLAGVRGGSSERSGAGCA